MKKNLPEQNQLNKWTVPDTSINQVLLIDEYFDEPI